jgi:FlaA1/EpsC-like NDP-sugar epimerase
MLAEQMIRLAGKQPGRDVAIEYIGLRAGEKLHETLFHVDERYSATLHPKILQAMPRGVASERIELAVKALREASDAYDLERLAAALRDAVPEFNPASDDEPVRDATVVAFPARRSRLNH